MKDKNKKYPEGYFIVIGIGLGISFGISLAISLGNMAFIGTGLPIGLGIGITLEDKYKKEGRIRPLNEDEKKKRKIGLISTLVLGIIVYLMFLFMILF
jgi:hypothetical protein